MRLARILLGASLLLTTGAVFVGFAASSVFATEAAPNVIKEITQPDGKNVKVRLWGDEFAHGWETLDGYTVALDKADKTWKYAKRDSKGNLVAGERVVGKDAKLGPKHLRPSAAAINAERKAQGVPAIGAYAAAPPVWAGSDTDVLFLYVEFSDLGCSFTPAQMQANMFGATASGPGNLADYYDEISYGALQIDGQVIGNAAGGGTDCITLANTHDFYDGAGGNADQMVTDAVAIADAYVDFSAYDNDGNGVVDALGLIYAGGGTHDGCAADDGAAGSGGDSLWPHSGGVGPLATGDGVTVNPHIVNSELTYATATPPPPLSDCNQIQTIGLFAHEFGHSLGLPDLYDTDGSSSGVGNWSAMASQYISTVNNADTPGHFDPWSKWFLGWITPTDYTGQNVSLALDRVEDNGQVAQFLSNPGGAERGGSGQYFLVENRQKVGFDQGLDGCGILVWHMDEAKTENTDEGHTAATHRLVDLEQADGLNHLSMSTGGNRGDAGDPYPGTSNNRLFADTTNPTANLYNASPSGVRVSVLGGCAASMLVNFGLPVADLAIFKSDNPDPVTAGGTLEYDITVVNNGPGNVANVVVTDVLPAGVTFQSSSVPCTNAAGTLTCALGTLLDGNSKNFQIQVGIPAGFLSGIPAATTNISNTASVTSDQPDGTLSNNSVTISTAVIQSADLRVTKICEPTGIASAGDLASCEIYVDNLGPSAAQGVVLTDVLTGNAPFTVSSATATPAGCGAPPVGPVTVATLTCNLGIEPAGGRTTIRVEFTSANTATVNNVASVTSTTPDPGSLNNSASGSVSFSSTADIALTKTALPDPVYAGEDLTYTLTVINNGPSTALNVVITDTLPAGMIVKSITTAASNTCISGVPGNSAQPLTCNMGNIANGASEIVTVVVTILASTPDGTVFNQANATTLSHDPNTGDNNAYDSTTVLTKADLSLLKSSIGSPIAGTSISYLYTISNAGPSNSREVALRDLLPAGMEFISAFNAVGGVAVGAPLPCQLVAAGSNEWSCPLGDIAPTGVNPKQIIVNVRIKADVLVGTILTNSATLVSSTTDSNSVNNTTNVPVNVLTSANLQVVNMTPFDTYKPSSTVVYTVTVTNLGPSDAQAVVVTYLLPDLKQAIYQIDTGGCTKAGLTLTCNLGKIAAGANTSFNVHVTIKGKKGQVSTTANVSSTTSDPLMTNNTSKRTVLIKGGL